jgi:sugar phosphate isomerase/epimerase
MSTRRYFLQTVLGTSAASVLAAADKLSYKGENIQFGLVTYMWGADWDLPTLIKNCETAKVLGVELRIEHAHKIDVSLTQEQRKEVRGRFADSQVKLLGMGTNFEFHSPEVAVLKKNIAGAKEYIKLSHDIGGTGVKVKPNALPKDVPTEKTLAQIGMALAELGDYALGFGQQIRLEVHGKETSDLSHNRTIMETAARDNVRVCWNSNPEDLAGDGIEANFAKVKDFLGQTVHIREVNEGDYPYDKLAKLLVEADYEGFVCLEARTKPEDRVKALAEQRELFMQLVTQARQAAKD